MRRTLSFLTLAATMLLALGARAQLDAEYLFSTGVDEEAWIDIGTGTQLIAPSAGDYGVSAVTNIGFTFNLAGVEYTQFSVNADGMLRLGPTVVATSTYSNPLNGYLNSDLPKICALGCDGYITSNGYAKYAVVGDEGERTLVVEVSTHTYSQYSDASQALKFQIQLSENRNIRLVYGSAGVNPSVTRQIGLATSTTDVVRIDDALHTIIMAQGPITSTSAAGTWPGENRYYAFTYDESLCAGVNDLAATDITESSATITWQENENASEYRVVVLGTEIDEVVSDNSIELTNLNGSTAYTVSVYSICGAGDTSNARNLIFRTECAAIATLPWTDGFESYTTEQLPDCYTQLSPSSSSSNYARTYSYTAHSGNQCLRFNYVDGNNVVMLPPFTEDISGMEISFWHRPESNTNNYCGTMQVGYLTDPADASTFVPVGSWAYSDFESSEYRLEEANFADAPEGARIAFRHVGTGTANWYWHIDDIDVHPIPDCVRPMVTVSDIAGETATLNISDANDAGSYRVYLSGWTDTITVEGNTYELEDLTPSSSYTATVWTICSDEYSQPRTINFRTECGVMQLPYTTSFAQTVAPCWYNPGGMSVTASEQAVYTSTASYRLVSMSIPGGVADKVVRIVWRGYNSGYNTQVGIGDQNGNNVQWIMTSPAVDDYTESLIFLNQYTGTENHLVIGGGTGYVYIRSISIEAMTGCAPVTGLHVASLSSDEATIEWNEVEDANGYIVEYQAGNSNTWTLVEDVDGTSTTLSGLLPVTSYTVRVRTDCGDDTSFTMTNTFTTECGAYPFPWSCPQSDLYTIGNANWNDCWSFTNNVYRSTSNGILYVYCQGANTEFRLPPVDITDFSQTQLRLHAACTTANAQFCVGVRNGDVTEWIDTITATVTSSVTDAVEYVIPLGNYEGEGNIVVLGGVDSKLVYVQAFFIEPLDQCPPVSNMSVSVIDETSATLSWVSNGEESEWAVYLNGELVEIVGATSYAFSDLAASTQYTVSVSAICGAGDTARAILSSFRTPCGTINHSDLPLTEDFESLQSGTQPIPCWTINSEWSYPQVSTSSATTVDDESVGGKVYYAYTYTSGVPNYTITPRINDLSDLMASCYVMRISPGANLTIGVMTDPDDVSTFVAVSDVFEADGNWTKVEAYLSTVENIENYHYVAFRQGMNSGTGGLYIDNIFVGLPVGCAKPQNLAVSNITSQSATLSWVHPDDVENFTVSYTVDGVTYTEEVAGTTYELTGLNASSSYTVSVVAHCDEGENSLAARTTFRTPCAEITSLPWTEDFESMTRGTGNEVSCWGILAGTGSTWTTQCTDMIYPSYHTTHEASNGNMLVVFSSLGYYSYGTKDGIAILPPFDLEPADITLSFQYVFRTDNNIIEVGLITDITNGATFTALDTIEHAITDTLFDYSITIPNYDPATNGRLAVRYDYYLDNDYWFAYFDNFAVNYAGDVPQPACARPTNLHTTNVGTTTATLDWNSDASNWKISVDNGAEQTVSSHPYTLTDLVPNSNYTVRVKAVCDDGQESSWATVSFSTEPTQGIDDVASASVSLYPNPATSMVSVSFEGKATVCVLDMSGREVLRTEANSSATLDVSRLARGTYFVRVGSEHYTAVRKLVVK